MNRELEDRLCAQYPEIFAARNDQASRYPIILGIECCDCWYDLLNTLCAGLQAATRGGDPQLLAFQVKEKFGALRFYVDPPVSSRQQRLIDEAELRSARICAGHCGRVRKRDPDGESS
jgi:hypothetical protein